MRCCATGRTVTNLARLSTWRCLDVWGWRRFSWAAMWFTDDGRSRSNSTMRRRLGSARALNIVGSTRVSILDEEYSCQGMELRGCAWQGARRLPSERTDLLGTPFR